MGTMKLAMTTVSLPHLTLEEQVDFAARLGFDGLYLRVRHIPEAARGGPYANWGNHKSDLNPRNFVQLAPRIKQLCDDAGLAVAAVSGLVGPSDSDDVRRLADGAALCASQLVRVSEPACVDGKSARYRPLFDQELHLLRRVVEILEPTGVRGLVEIRRGTTLGSATLAYQVASNFPPSAIGVIYDARNIAQAGYEGIRLGLDVLGPYLAHVHIGGRLMFPLDRDVTGTQPWEWRTVDLRDGLLNNRTLWAELKRIGYDGFLTIEDFDRGDLGDVEARHRSGVEYMRRIEAIDG
jgi:sugar phosphate isomerase/epimerase